MAITKEEIVDKIEIVEDGVVHVRTATVIKEDGTEISRTFHRHFVNPSSRSGDNWVDTDISSESTRVQAVCNATWTSAVKTAFQEAFDAGIPKIPSE